MERPLKGLICAIRVPLHISLRPLDHRLVGEK